MIRFYLIVIYLCFYKVSGFVNRSSYVIRFPSKKGVASNAMKALNSNLRTTDDERFYGDINSASKTAILFSSNRHSSCKIIKEKLVLITNLE